MMQLQNNTFLQGGKYRMEKVLGQGGFGITYLATQMSYSEKKVVILQIVTEGLCELKRE